MTSSIAYSRNQPIPVHCEKLTATVDLSETRQLVPVTQHRWPWKLDLSRERAVYAGRPSQPAYTSLYQSQVPKLSLLTMLENHFSRPTTGPMVATSLSPACNVLHKFQSASGHQLEMPAPAHTFHISCRVDQSQVHQSQHWQDVETRLFVYMGVEIGLSKS